MQELLIDPLSFGTTSRALVEMTILGIAGGVLGCWVVLFRLSYGAESLAHGMLPGLVLAGIIGIPLLAGGAFGIVLAGILVAIASRMHRSDPDTSIAVVVTTLFGAGILIALSPAAPAGVGELLFGNLLGTGWTEIIVSAIATLLVLVVLGLFHFRLLAVGFDGDSAGFAGVPGRTVNLVLLVLVAATILVSVQALGTLLVAALLVGPAATARLLTRRIGPMIVTSAFLATVAGLAGLYASFHLKTAAGASIVVFILLFFLTAAALGAARPGFAAIDRGSDQMMPGNATSRQAADGWSGYALERLDSAGYRRGGSRRKVIEFLATCDCAVTALEIDQRLDGVGRASVYRTLEQLEELELVHRVALGGDSTAFERVDPAGHHHHHLVCTRCGRVVPFEDEALEEAIHELPSKEGFTIEGHEVTLRGTCRRCGAA
ncbi:MAG: metal ABC transporter permease [Solirubrobacterales bacterium]